MYSFGLISESAGIGHIEHPSDLVFDSRQAGQRAIDTVRGVASGTSPVTRKIDDRVSFHVLRTPEGTVGVRYKGKTGKYGFSPEEVRANNSGKPYSESLALLQKHLGKVLPKTPGEYQGGYMSSPEERETDEKYVSHQPNSIRYSVPLDTDEGNRLAASKVSATIHTRMNPTTGEPEPIYDMEGFSEHPDVHIHPHVVSTAEQMNLSPLSKRQVSAHLDRAQEHMDRAGDGHTAGHQQLLRRYVNSTIQSGDEPDVKGYSDFLRNHHSKQVESVKTDRAKERKRAAAEEDLRHLSSNKEKFASTLKAHHHLQQATNILARELGKRAHGGYFHELNGEPTDPEGFVSNGLKIVDRHGFSAANRARHAILRASRNSGE